MATISAADWKEMQQRAKEWKQFRADYLFTQRELAQTLGIARRTIQSIESEVTVCPSFIVQRKFLALKRKHELERVELLEAQRRREREAKIEAQWLAALASGSKPPKKYRYSGNNPAHLFRRHPVSLGG
jgi:DNA-binding XRE family transcriptional regulator